MRKGKAIATNTAILILIIIILVASVIGVVWYYTTRPEPIPPLPGEFVLSDLTVSPSSVIVGGSVTVSVDVTNEGDYDVTGSVTLVLNEKVEEIKEVTVAAGETETVTFTVTKSVAAVYAVTIPGTALTGTLTVTGAVPKFVTDNKVVYESGNTFQWFDPHVSYYMYDYQMLYHTLETLVWYNGSSATEVIPWLAETFTMINASCYEAELREGIYFQDGTPFNATAVWFSYNRILIIDGYSGVGTPGSQAAWIIQQMLDESLSTGISGVVQPHDAAWVQAVLDQNFVEIVNNYKIRLNLINPTTAILDYLSGAWASIVSPTSVIKGDYEYGEWGTWDGDYNTYFEHMAGNGFTAFNLPEEGWRIGTGPYIFDSVDPTTYRIVLKKNPDYWGGPPDNEFPMTPSIDEIEFLYVPSFTTRLLDLKAYDVTGIAVDPADIFSVVDRDTWIDTATFVSLIPDVNIYGLYPLYVTTWFNFCTNVTDVAGNLREFQPFCDWRFRMAVASAVNLTDINIYVNNRIWLEADNLIPPGTAPTGAYDPTIKPVYSFDLTKAAELLVDAMNNPKTQFTYYNGTPIPSGVVDNSFGPTKPRTIELYVPAGAVTNQKVLTVITENLNTISVNNNTGLTWTVVPVPGGQQYTLAAMHQVHMYWGGWHADYNHIINWLWPMLVSTGSYFSWNLINNTRLDALYKEVVAADRAGDAATMLEKSLEMVRIANEEVYYLYLWYRMQFNVRSSFLKNYYFNPALGADIYTAMYYETE